MCQIWSSWVDIQSYRLVCYAIYSHVCCRLKPRFLQIAEKYFRKVSRLYSQLSSIHREPAFSRVSSICSKSKSLLFLRALNEWYCDPAAINLPYTSFPDAVRCQFILILYRPVVSSFLHRVETANSQLFLKLLDLFIWSKDHSAELHVFFILYLIQYEDDVHCMRWLYFFVGSEMIYEINSSLVISNVS